MPASGDLFGNVRRGDDALRKRDAVVGQEDDANPAAEALIAVDVFPDDVDRADDVLRDVVARSGLGGEHEDPRMDVQRRVLQQAAVQGQDVQQIEVLPLVFVQALHLDVEDRVRGNLDPAFAFDQRGQVDLVVALHRQELAAEAGIVREALEPAKPGEVADPARSCRGCAVISVARRGFAWSSQRRGVMPLVLLLNLPG